MGCARLGEPWRRSLRRAPPSGNRTGPRPCRACAIEKLGWDFVLCSRRSGRTTIRSMKKVLVFAVMLVGLAVLAKRFGPNMQNMDWEKRFERMPDNAPPKWIFRNVTAIRENTDRILQLLERDGSSSASSPTTAT